MAKKLVTSLAGALCLVAGASAQATAPQWGQCGGQGWTGATTCPSGWVCTVSNQWYSQCLQGTAPPPPPPPPPPSGPTTSAPIPPTSVSSAPAGTTPTLISGFSFIRAVEDPNFHQYLRSEVEGTVGDAVLGDPVDAAQFQINNGQLQQTLSNGGWLYAAVAPPNTGDVKLKVSWQTTPDTLGTFAWSGDTVTWTSASISRPQSNAWLVCPDAAGNKDLYVNLGPYDYDTPAGCADETIHAYTGPYPTS